MPKALKKSSVSAFFRMSEREQENREKYLVTNFSDR